MVNKTPLRLVVSDTRPVPDDDDGSAPIVKISDEEAITRKVPESAMIAAHDTFTEKPHRFRGWHNIVPAAAVAVLIVVIAVALITKGKRATPAGPPAVTRAAPGAPPSVEPVPRPQPVSEPPAPVAATPPPAAPAETIHVQITAAPVQAVLSLDGNVLAGHRLSLELPKDRGIHVVSASAPGYVPFNQQVSFARDVVLDIDLRRVHASAGRPVARGRTSAPEPQAKPDLKPAPTHIAPRVEPGMNLDGPGVRATGKPIDERNPYKP